MQIKTLKNDRKVADMRIGTKVRRNFMVQMRNDYNDAMSKQIQ